MVKILGSQNDLRKHQCTPLRNAFSRRRNGKDNPANIFLTLDIEHDGFAPLLVNDGVCEDAGDQEESE